MNATLAILTLALVLFVLGGLLFARFRGDQEMGVADTSGREAEPPEGATPDGARHPACPQAAAVRCLHPECDGIGCPLNQ